MGSGESVPRRVTFEADENDNVTVVKGVRLSENVIERMKEPYSPGEKPQQKLGSRDHSLFGGAAVSEEELKKRIADELALEQARRDVEAHKRLKQNRKFLQDDVSNEQLARAILRERTASDDERRKAQLLAKQLEEKERELKKQDAYYKEQVARLEERSSQFYKVTTEQYQKAVDAVGARFKRFKSKPVCAELQGKILECYQQNPQETLSCSTLASEYLKCVHHARQGRAGRGG